LRTLNAAYLENRMGLTITSVWRVLVYDTENTLDQVRYIRTVPSSLLSSEWHAH